MNTDSPRLELVLGGSEVRGEFVRRSCVLRRVDGSRCTESSLWYELPSQLPQIAPDDGEPFLVAAIMDAMAEDRALHVGGKVSFQLLSNLHEFMVVWARCFPSTYRVVEVTADVVASSSFAHLSQDVAVALHTGALDASCTLYRHANGLEGHRSRRIAACVMIQGHLIPLGSDEKFANGMALARTALDSIGVAAHPLRTNFREVIRARWNDVYGVAAISALYFFKPLAPSCLISGAKAYDNPNAFPNGSNRTPNGSNPLTNALLSSDSMQVLHDGSRFSFVEKVAIVAGWPEGSRNLRVCWRGGQLGANCGRCEECLRTKLAFLALGERCPASLGDPPSAREILGFFPLSYDGKAELSQILSHCRRLGIRARWIRALRFRLRFDGLYRRFHHVGWILRRLAGKNRA